MTYAKSVGLYYAAGWRCILPVPAHQKWPPPDGYTGAHGIDVVSSGQISAWQATHADHSVALRLPEGVIALDIDHYDKAITLPTGETKITSKRGAGTVAEFERQWGALPLTWASTARPGLYEGGSSRTLWFRVPPGRYASALGDGVEVLQRHHRYCVVWPSHNPDAAGAPYRWYAPTTENAAACSVAAWRVPAPHEFAELPPEWVTGLAEGASAASPHAAPGDQGVCLLAALTPDDRRRCAEIENALQQGRGELTGAAPGSRHDAATRRAYQIIRLGAYGHTGAGSALGELAEHWATLTAGEGRETEWDRMCLSAACKAVTEVGSAVPLSHDPCAIVSRWAPPTPVTVGLDSMGEVPVFVAGAPDMVYPSAAPGIEWSRRELIGTYQFDPSVGLDQLLADAVLNRVHPVLRYAADAGGWVIRGPYAWELRSDMADWAVSELLYLMPRGDSEAAKGTTERNRAERRKRFGSTGGSNAIAAKMRARVRPSDHPCSVRLADLDSDPETLWAGGQPWSLRESLERPILATVDVATPHLEAAGVPPSGLGIDHPTPLWNAYTAAIWPDPEIREWALRVLSVGLTGYSDSVLPILLGNTGLGKTSIISLLMSTLGSYACAADPRLISSTDNTHASIICILKGKRLAFIDEGPRDGRAAVERLKQLTGGAELTGNMMRMNPITFVPTHTLVLTCNPEQVPTFGDPALRRRVRLIPCEGDPAQVAATRAAITGTAWRAEAPGVLAVMMHRAALYLADRRLVSRDAAPKSIRYRTEEIAAQQDLVRGWLEAEMEPHPDGMRTSDLIVRYAEWARTFRVSPPNLTQFGLKLSELGYPPLHRRDGNYRGLRVRPPSGIGPYVPPPAPVALADIPQMRTEHDQAKSANEDLPPSTDLDTRNGSSPRPDSGSADAHACTSAPAYPLSTNGAANAEVQSQSGDSGDTLMNVAENGTAISEGQRSLEDPIHDMTDLQEHTISTDVRDQGVKGMKGCEPRPAKPSHDQQCPDQPLLVGCEGLKGLDPSSPPIKNLDTNKTKRPTKRSNEKNTQQTGAFTLHPSPDPAQAHPDQAVLVVSSSGEQFPDPSPLTSAIPANPAQTRTEQPDEIRAELADLRARRTKLTKDIRAAAKTDPATAADLTATRAQLIELIKETERRLRAAVALATRAESIAAAAGPIVSLPAVKIRGRIPESVDLAGAMRWVREAVARDGGRVTVDLESTGYPIGHPDHAVRTVQLGDWWAVVVFDLADPAQFATAALLLAEAPELQAYSAAVELSHLSATGLLDFDRDWPRVHDVVIPAQLDNPVGTLSSEAGLKHQSALRIPAAAVSPAAEAARVALFKAAGWVTDTKIKGGGWVPRERSGWARVDPACVTMVEYAASDVLDTAALARVLPPVPLAVYGRERAVQAAVGGVSYRGLRLDRGHIEEMISRCEPARDAAALALRQMGIDNPASNDQVAQALMDRGAQLRRTDTGKPSVAADVLDTLSRTPELEPCISQLLTYRHYNRMLSTYLRPYQLLIRYGDGRVRSVVYTLQADTGRMSSAHENLQNIPTHGGVRECIISDVDDLFIDADLTGVEVAVLAALSQDPALIEIVHGTKKLHKIIAETVFGLEYTTQEYGWVKNGVFARFYGAGIERVAATVHCPVQVAQSMADVLDEIAPGARDWGYRWRNAVKNGATSYELYSGRVLHLPQQFPHKIVNYLVQATAREIFVDGLLRWAHTRWGRYKVTVPVHDEILSTAPAAEAAEAQAALCTCMQTEIYGVRIGADPKWRNPSPRWWSNDATEAA